MERIPCFTDSINFSIKLKKGKKNNGKIKHKNQKAES